MSRACAAVRPSATAWVVCGLVALHALLWLTLPAINPHLDGLDELKRLEQGTWLVSERHPFSEPAAAAYWSLVDAIFSPERSLRAMQLWGGFWTGLALLALGGLLRRLGATLAWTVAALLVIGFNYPATHLATDPFMYYRPAGFAFALGALFFACGGPAAQATGRRGWGRWLATLLLVLAVGFEPMTASAVPAAMLLWLRHAWPRTQPELSGAASSCAAFRPSRLAWLQAAGFALGWLPVLIVHAMISAREAGGSLLNGSFENLVPRQVLDSWVQLHLGSLFSLHDPAPRGAWVAAGRAALLALHAALLVGLAAGIVRRRPGPAGGLRGIFWVGLAGVVWMVSLWWGGLQTFFFLLPVAYLWIGAAELGWLAADALPRPWTRLLAGLALAAGVLTATVNLSAYVWPRAHQPAFQLESARLIAPRFQPGDLLVDAVWGDFSLAYYTDLKVLGLMTLTGTIPDDESCFRELQRTIDVTHVAGSRAWFQEQADRAWLHDSFAVTGMTGYRPLDESRFILGERREAAGRVYHELLGIAPLD